MSDLFAPTKPHLLTSSPLYVSSLRARPVVNNSEKAVSSLLAFELQERRLHFIRQRAEPCRPCVRERVCVSLCKRCSQPQLWNWQRVTGEAVLLWKPVANRNKLSCLSSMIMMVGPARQSLGISSAHHHHRMESVARQRAHTHTACGVCLCALWLGLDVYVCMRG